MDNDKYMDKDRHKDNIVGDAGECQRMSENVSLHRVAEIVQRHEGPSQKNLDPDEN